MKMQPRYQTDWRQTVYDALVRYCADRDITEENTGSEEYGTRNTAPFEPGDVDFRTFSGEGLSLSKVASLCLVAQAFARSVNLENVWHKGATTICHTKLESSFVSWSIERLLPDYLGISWDGRSKACPMLRMVHASKMDPHRSTFEHGLVDTLARNDDPVIFLTQTLVELHPAVAMFDANVVSIEEINHNVLSILFALRYPALSEAEIERLVSQVPDLSAVSLQDLDCIVLAFRQIHPEAIPGLISRYLEGISETKPSTAPKLWQPSSIVPLKDLVGLGAAKIAAQDALEALREWQAGELPWSAVPRGILLVGPAGTGKTELARSLAGEAGIHLVTASYNQWQKAGGLSCFLEAMEQSFKEAKRQTPSVLFIDEIDAFYTRTDLRGDGRNDSYDIKAITGLLEKLDGISDREGVIVIGACNHLKFVDAAIRRAGRFDQVIEVGLPTLEELEVILAQHLGDRAFGIDLMACAAAALGCTGADCAAAVRTAGAMARRRNRAISTDDVIAALNGHAPSLSEKEWLRLAVHECGHAIVATAFQVGEVEYARLGRSGGECKVLDKKMLQTEEDLHIFRCVALAGREAERLVFGTISAGAGGVVDSDTAKATQSAADQICSYGLGSLGSIWLASPESLSSLREAVTGHLPEVAELLHAAEKDAKSILHENQDLLVAMAKQLSSLRVLHGENLMKYLSQVSVRGSGNSL